jgi:hypothetical protein
MSGGFDQSLLAKMWDAKWPNLNQYLNLYNPVVPNAELRDIIYQKFSPNQYLSYVQNVGY